MNLRIYRNLFGVLFVFCLFTQIAFAGELVPEQAYDPDSQQYLPSLVEPSKPFSQPIRLICHPILHQFNMNTSEVIAIIDDSTKQCVTGSGFVARYWDISPIVLAPTADTKLSVRLDETSIPLYTGYPIVNILLYSGPRDSSDFCINLLDSTTKNSGGSFSDALQQPGETYEFRDPQTGNPLILEAGKNYYIYAHTSATFDSGTADVTFEHTDCKEIPALSKWGVIILSLLLAALALFIFRRKVKLI